MAGNLENVGYTGLEAVWVSINESIAYINFACVKDGIIYYPDLIKVKISLIDGSGIGLALSRQIIRLHGGTIHLSRNTDDKVAFLIVME